MTDLVVESAVPHRGDEFRDDRRAVAGRVLPPEVLARLTALDDARSLRAVAGTLGALACVIGLAAWLWSAWIVLPAVVAIAAFQHAMFVLAHDAAHYRLFAHRGINDAVGRLLGMASGISMCAYRVVHRLHHNHLYGPQDPDSALHGGYPRGRAYLRRKLLGDLAGLTAWKTFRYFFGLPAANTGDAVHLRPLDDTSPALRAAALRDRWGVVAWQIGLPATLFAIGGADWLLRYAVLWLLPLATVLQALLRLRAIAEHGAPAGLDSPLRAARTNLAGPFARFFLFPHHVNHHVEHHLYPAVPHYRLPELHAELTRRGVLAGAEVRPLRETWARVYAAREAHGVRR